MRSQRMLLSALLILVHAPFVACFVSSFSSQTRRSHHHQQQNHGQALHTTSITVSTVEETMPWTMNGGYSMENDWGWAFTSVPDDACSSYICDDVEGTIPKDLVGTFYRNGPGKLERNGQRYQHVFDGDGFIAAIHFHDNGQVQYTGRFVETEYFIKEEEEDAILYRNALGTERPGGVLANAFNVDIKNVANTNVMQFGDRLFAFWEAGSPYELNPHTLQTIQNSGSSTTTTPKRGPSHGLGDAGSLRGVTIDDGGPIDQALKFGRAFTAHPHYDQDNQRFVAFRWAQHALRKDMRLEFVEYDDQWRLQQKTMYSIDKCNLAPHDFCTLSDYYCFFENRMEMDTLPFLLGLRGAALCMTQRLDLPTRVHLVPRNDNNNNKKAIQLDVPSFFSIHTLSPGMETKDPVTGDTLLTVLSSGWDYSDHRLFPNQQGKVPFLGAWGGPYPDFDIMPPSQLWRTIINVDEQVVEQHSVVIPGINLEYPRIDERYPHIVYAPCSWIKSNGLSDPTTGFCQIDTIRNSVKYWWAGPKIFCGELIPVPKRNSKGKEVPGGGSWLLSLVHDAKRKRVSLVIIDSERFEEGPICWIHLKHTLTWGIHGSFTSR